ncbi:NAD(P)-binding protein [Ramlibacter sp.]|uniref:NAD(P)-binding protein n=1 Tax=Ramlibacter sp. TaxID=1917967 RepID=UPI0035B4BE0E
MHPSSTDYLVIGSGATGLAFADTLIAETSDVTVTLVDLRGRPGGHWNDAYPFVTLHQPSAFYGVNSTPLGQETIDTQGPNKGMFELASGAEVVGYFDTVLRQKLLPTGRVQYLPMTEHLGGGQLRSVLTGESFSVEVRRRIVDARYLAPGIPALHRRKFETAPEARVIHPRELAQIGLAPGAAPRHFAILGAGKTAMDVASWLLGSGVPADRITWVMPRDSWLINRRTTQPGMDFFHDSIGGQAVLMKACAEAQSANDLFLRLEAAGFMLRIDPAVMPRMFHFATISQGEVDELRQIRDVVRLGHVQAVESAGVRLAEGFREMPPGTLYIDCTASAVEQRPLVPMFQPGLIVPQIVRAPLPTFSAAFVAHVEALGGDDDHKNELCRPVPFPDSPSAYPLTLLANFRNDALWSKDKALRDWLTASRLDGFRKMVASVRPDDVEKMRVLGAIREYAPAAVGNLQRLAAARAG